MFNYVCGPEETIPITRTAINNSAFQIHGSRVLDRLLCFYERGGKKIFYKTIPV